jgi:hypothetical protein
MESLLRLVSRIVRFYIGVYVRYFFFKLLGSRKEVKDYYDDNLAGWINRFIGALFTLILIILLSLMMNKC